VPSLDVVKDDATPPAGPCLSLLGNNDLDHAGCLPPKENMTDRETYMYVPITCSSLIPEREEHLTNALVLQTLQHDWSYLQHEHILGR
jgi:hypothetical protein